MGPTTSDLASEAAHTRSPGEIAGDISRRDPRQGARLLEQTSVLVAAEALQRLNPGVVQSLLPHLPPGRRAAIVGHVLEDHSRQWKHNETYPDDSVGRLMDHPRAVFRPDTTVSQTVAELRDLVKHAFLTYLFVADEDGRLIGVVAMRELLLAGPDQRLEEIMLRDPFRLAPETSVLDAMRQVVTRHFPVYPVCDGQGHLVGLVRGQTLFEAQAFELSAQAGKMVGVEKEERLTTPWQRSLKFRHPWLQLNLLTAFIAAAVVGAFQATIDQIVLLAVFLPVLAGQSGNTGSQALAVTLRGLTLGEMVPGRERMLVTKEALLGLLNGALVGLTASAGMFIYASSQQHPSALLLALVVFLAMVGSCLASGISGALVPLGLRKLGADPATASSIFLTTATDVASMALFLGLATWLVL